MNRRRMKTAAAERKEQEAKKTRLVGYLKDGVSLGSAAVLCKMSIHEAAAIISK